MWWGTFGSLPTDLSLYLCAWCRPLSLWWTAMIVRGYKNPLMSFRKWWVECEGALRYRCQRIIWITRSSKDGKLPSHFPFICFICQGRFGVVIRYEFSKPLQNLPTCKPISSQTTAWFTRLVSLGQRTWGLINGWHLVWTIELLRLPSISHPQ